MRNVVMKKDDLEDKSAEIQYKAFRELGLELPELLDPKLRYRVTGIRANDLAHDTFFRFLFEETENIEIIRFRETEEAKRVKEYLLKHGYDPKRGRKTYYREFICNPLTPFYIDQTVGRLSIQEIADESRKYGAIVLLAHPGIFTFPMMGFVNENYVILEESDRKAKANGVKTGGIGAEIAHRNMTLGQKEQMLEFRHEKQCMYAAESDFHDPKVADQIPFHVNGGQTLIKPEWVSPEWYTMPSFKEWQADYNKAS